jgi:hypothetical protein
MGVAGAWAVAYFLFFFEDSFNSNFFRGPKALLKALPGALLVIRTDLRRAMVV